MKPIPTALSILVGAAADVFEERRMGKVAKPSRPPGRLKKSEDLELALRFGFVVPLTSATTALSEVQETALLMIERLPLHAAEITAAAAANGEPGVSMLLEKITIDLRKQIAAAWQVLAGKGRTLASIGPITIEPSEKSA